MIWKKTWFSYFICIFFTLVGIGLLFTSSFTFSEGTGLPIPVRSVCIPVLLFGLFLGCFIALYKYLLHREEKDKKNNLFNKKKFFEWFLLITILFIGGFIRYLFIPTEYDNLYFNTAKIAENQAVAISSFGLEYLYIKFLQFFFMLFGNKWIVGIIVQNILYFIACLIFYIALRKSVGVLPSVFTLLVLSFSNGSIIISTNYGTEMFFLCFFSFGLFFIIRNLSKDYSNESIVWCLIANVSLGIYCGCLLGLEFFSILLIVFMFTLFWIKDSAHKIIRFTSYLLGVLLGLFLYFCIFGILSNETFFISIKQWIDFIGYARFVDSAQFCKMVFYGGYLPISLILLFSSFTFFISKEIEKFSGWFLGFLATILLVFLQISKESQIGFLLLFCFMAIIFGNAVIQLSMIRHPRFVSVLSSDSIKVMDFEESKEKENMIFKKEKSYIENERPAYNPALFEDANKEKNIRDYTNSTSQPVPVVRAQVPEEKENIVDVETPSIVEQSSEGGEKVVKTEKKIQLIENPLPVPKKHVKKTMDFDFEPTEDKMFFDYWVTNEDDFDHK